ncbi:MAG TPA: SGNH/GDSL hydrolase family protein [Stellaceae bacterium]|nr:SGNH/GDSL hydrolase family protein [Stellaceae bacterium]
MPRRLVLVGLALLAVAAAVFFVVAGPVTEPLRGLHCVTPSSLTKAQFPLMRTAERLRDGGPLTIVAIGSSSTEGYAASSPAASYPSRLEVLLRKAFPGVEIRVINKGVSGEEADQMISRFDRDVIAQHPDLTIWQFGSNAVVRDRTADSLDTMLRHGIARLKASDTDLLLMDLQVAPMIIDKPGHTEMVREIADLALSEQIGVIRRFAIMSWWLRHARFTLNSMLAYDGLHMSDGSYACLADAVSRIILDGTGQTEMLPRLTARRANAATE